MNPEDQTAVFGRADQLHQEERERLVGAADTGSRAGILADNALMPSSKKRTTMRRRQAKTDRFGASLRRYTLPDGNHIGALIALVVCGITIGSAVHAWRSASHAASFSEQRRQQSVRRNALRQQYWNSHFSLSKHR